MRRFAIQRTSLLAMSIVLAPLIAEATTAPEKNPASTRGEAPATVATWAEALSTPELAGPGIPVRDKTWTEGHLELRLERGTVYPLAARTMIVGWFFVGRGRFTYTSTDPLEAANFKTNVNAASGYRLSGSSVGDQIDSVLVLDPRGATRIAGKQGFLDGDVPVEAVEALKDHEELFARLDDLDLANMTAQALVEPPSRPFRAVEIHGSEADAIHLYDTLRDDDESLFVVHGYRSRSPLLVHRRYPAVLSKQPIGRKLLAPRPKPWTLTDVDLTLVNPSGLEAQLTTDETITAHAPVRVIALSLSSRISGGVGVLGATVENPYHLISVTLADGTRLAFSHRNDDLIVELPRALEAGESANLKFVIRGDILFRPGNDSYWLLPVGPWLPLPERMDEQAFTYHAIIKTARPFVPFSNGTTVVRWRQGDLNCAEFRLYKPIQFPVVLAGRYQIFSEYRNGVTVRVATYVLADHQAMKRLSANIFALLDFYHLYLGDFPFKELDLIEINSYGFGIAPAGIIFITKEAFEPLANAESKLFSRGNNARLAHEVAHTWWGHVGKMSGPESQWLSESMAEYFSAFAMSHLERPSAMDHARREWRRISRGVQDHGSIYLANQLSGYNAGRDRFALLYGKGPLVLDALRKKLGDREFFTVCRSMLTSSPFHHLYTRQFIGLTNLVKQRDFGPWFGKYLLGTDWP